jgi:hypothetical protein
MRRSRICRVVAVFMAIAVIASATVALAHGHLPSKSQDKAPCGICMAAQGTSLALLSAPTAVDIRTAVEMVIPRPEPLHHRAPASHTTQDRAPPQN